MDFTSPEVYAELEGAVRKEDGFDVVTLPSGSTIYRADATGKKKPYVDVPNFFSDKDSIKPYTGNNPSTISSYTTKKDLKLFVLSYDNIEKLADSDDSIAEFVDTYYMADVKFEDSNDVIPVIIPVNDTHGRYTNREFATIVCSTKKYDGWIAFPDSLIQRNLDTKVYKNNPQQYAIDKSNGNVQYTINSYAPEIVICNWEHTMDYKGGRKMTRKYCKKTPCKKMGFTQRASCRPWKNCYKNKK